MDTIKQTGMKEKKERYILKERENFWTPYAAVEI